MTSRIGYVAWAEALRDVGRAGKGEQMDERESAESGNDVSGSEPLIHLALVCESVYVEKAATVPRLSVVQLRGIAAKGFDNPTVYAAIDPEAFFADRVREAGKRDDGKRATRCEDCFGCGMVSNDRFKIPWVELCVCMALEDAERVAMKPCAACGGCGQFTAEAHVPEAKPRCSVCAGRGAILQLRLCPEGARRGDYAADAEFLVYGREPYQVVACVCPVCVMREGDARGAPAPKSV